MIIWNNEKKKISLQKIGIGSAIRVNSIALTLHYLCKQTRAYDHTCSQSHLRRGLQISDGRRAYSQDTAFGPVEEYRLTSAAANAKMRQDMNVEDEYFSAIEKRDTEIMVRDKRIEEQEIKLAEQDYKLAEKESQIRALVTALAGKGLSCEEIAALTGCKTEDIKLML